MQVNVNTRQIKTGFGLDSWQDPSERYPRQLAADPVKYITANTKAQEFIPKELKELADKAITAHAHDPKEKKSFEIFKAAYLKWFLTYKKPHYSSVSSPTLEETQWYNDAKNLNDYLRKTYYNGTNGRWEFEE